VINSFSSAGVNRPVKNTKILIDGKIKISVIAAIYNLQGSVELLNQDLQTALKRHYKKFEIVFVDDGSRDSSFQELKAIAQQFRNVKIVKLRTQFGESSALDAGLQVATGDCIIYFTGRVRVNPFDLIHLVKQLEQGSDVVIGVRTPRRDSALNQFVSKLFNIMTNRLTHLHLHDINSGVLAAHRSVFDHVPFYGTLNAFMPVLASRQGYKITEYNVEQLPGRFSQSMYPKNYIRRLLDLVSVVFLSGYSKKPLHFLGFIGAIFTIVGAVINMCLFIYRILGLISLAGRPMLLFGSMLFIVGIQMISIGLLGEIIIFTHAKDIKDYNIEEIIE
jgi:glycosyltransferase involved in cell wall biosynthesis